jgi:hypothetical protein
MAEQQEENRPEPFSFEGHDVFLLNDLITYDKAFFVGCIEKPRKTILKQNIPDDQYWFASFSERTEQWSKSIPENKKAKILISEEWVHNNLPKFTGNKEVYKYKPLPPLLELNDHEKFRDQAGNVHEVEVRGDRSKTGIRFSCKDIARVFEMHSIESNINKTLDNSDYEVFCSDKNTRGNRTVMFVSFKGLLKIIFASRSMVAEQFQDWATALIYTAYLGTTEQRIEMASEMIGVNAQMVKDVLTTCVTSMPCVYLFNVGKITNLRKQHEELKPFKKGFLFKWGRTNDLKRRTGEHIRTYGDLHSSALQLKYFSPVDNMHEVDAENEIRKYFEKNAVQFRNHQELIILDKSQISAARKFYEDVYDKYSSDVKKLIGSNADLKNIVKAKDEVIKNLNRELAEFKEREQTYLERERGYKEEIKNRQDALLEREQGYNERERGYKEEIKNCQDALLEREQTYLEREREYKCEINSLKQDNKNCQDALRQIALLSPEDHMKLKKKFEKTRRVLEPCLMKTMKTMKTMNTSDVIQSGSKMKMRKPV